MVVILEMIIFLIAFLISWLPQDADSFTVYRNGERIAQTQRLYFADTMAEGCIRHKYWITAWKYGRETVPSRVVSGLWLDWSCGCQDTMVWKAKQGDDLLKIVLPRSKWLCSWRLRDEVFRVLQDEKRKHSRGMAYKTKNCMGKRGYNSVLFRYKLYGRIYRNAAEEEFNMQKLLRGFGRIHQGSPADIKERIKCICLYDLNHDGVVDLSDFALLDTSIEHVQELAEFGRVYGRRAEYEFWR